MAKRVRDKRVIEYTSGVWQWYWWTVLVAVGLTPLIVGYFFNSAFELPKLVFLYGLALLGVGVFAWQCWSTKRFVWPRTWLEWPLLILLLLLAISTVFSLHWYTSLAGYYSRFNGGLLSYLTYAVLFYLALMGLCPPGEQDLRQHRLRQLMWVWLGSAGIVSVLAALQHFGFNYICILQGSGGCMNQLPRAISTIGQPNWLAAYLISAVPIGMALGLTTSEQKAKAAAWVLAAVSYAGLWYGYSRAAWLGLAVAMVVMVVCVPWKRWWAQRWWAVGLVAVCVIVSLTSFDTAALRAESITPGSDVEPSTTTSRLYVWQGTIPYIRDHPLIGTGPATFGYGFLPYRPQQLNGVAEWNGVFQQAHNEVLNRAATTGVPSLLAWFGLFVVAGVLAWRERCVPQLLMWWNRVRYGKVDEAPSQSSDEYGVLMVAVLAGMVGIFVAQLLGFAVVVTNLLLFVGLAAVAAGQVRFSERELVHPAVRGGVVAVLVAVVAFGWYGLYRYCSAEALDRQGNDLAAAQTSDAQSMEYALRTAADDYTLASQRNPLEAHYHADLAALYGRMLPVVTSDSRLTVLKAANAELTRTLQLNPDDLVLRLQVANVYVDMATFDKTYWQQTLDVLLAAQKQAPTSAVVQMGLADVYVDMNDLPKAKMAFERLVKLRPDGVETYSHRANYWQKVGDVTAERRDLEKALQLSLIKDKPAIQQRLDKLGS